jgi:hypothetical protein
MNKFTKEFLVNLEGVSYYETEPGRGYYQYKYPSGYGGFSTPDKQEFIEMLEDTKLAKHFE